jgi:hypothetical protein
MFILELAQALKAAKVDYAVVGGFAVALHGAVRGTVDVDIVLHLREKDFETAEKVFEGMGLESRLPVGAKEIFRFREEYIKNRNLVAWSFYDSRNPIHQLDVIITWDLGNLRSEVIKIHGVPVKVISKKDLIRMKRASGRPQDLADAEALEKLK